MVTCVFYFYPKGYLHSSWWGPVGHRFEVVAENLNAAWKAAFKYAKEHASGEVNVQLYSFGYKE